MKKFHSKAIFLFLVFIIAGIALYILEPSAHAEPATVKQVQKSVSQNMASGAGLADNMSRILGVGLSPIFGMAMTGLLEHLSHPESGQWYAQPWFFGPIIIVLCGIIVKDVFGAPLGPAKQTLDSLEVLINKLGGLLGLFATMSFAGATMSAEGTAIVQTVHEILIPGAHASNGLAATAGGSAVVGGLVASCIAGVTYFAVWLTGHAYTILVFLNPFTVVDPFLKGMRASMILFVAFLCWVSPLLGIIICLAYILFAFYVTGFCLRLGTYGSVLAWDFIFNRGKGQVQGETGLLAFSGPDFSNLPSRTMGRLKKNENGTHEFSYRPWLIFSRTSVTDNLSSCHVLRGVLFPSLEQVHVLYQDEIETENKQNLFHLSPRYRGKEEEINQLLNLSGVEDCGILKGFKSAMNHIRSLLRPTSSS